MPVLKRQDGVSGMPSLPTDPAYYTWSVQRQLTAIDLSLLLIALVAVLGRVYIRLFVLHVFRLDDYFMVAAMICSICGCSIFLYVVHLGMGKHVFAIKPENMTPLLMWIFIVSVLIPLAVGFVKLSIAFFLLSLLQRTRYRRFLWAVIVFLVVFLLFTFFTLILSCMPIAASWNFNLRPPPIGKGNARCLTTETYRNIAVVNSITNIVTDIVLAVIPIPLIWTLQVNKRTKASLIFILTLGFFACAAGIVKTPLLFHFFDDFDSTGNRSWYYAWQMIECNVGIIAATLPSLNPAFRWLLKTAKKMATGASQNRTSPSQAYKRKYSSGYIPHKDVGNSYPTALGVSSYLEKLRKEKRKGGHGGGVDVEMNELGRYNVTVAGDEKSDGRSGSGSNASSDAILRIEDVEAPTRGIVRTTKVTIVTS